MSNEEVGAPIVLVLLKKLLNWQINLLQSIKEYVFHQNTKGQIQNSSGNVQKDMSGKRLQVIFKGANGAQDAEAVRKKLLKKCRN